MKTGRWLPTLLLLAAGAALAQDHPTVSAQPNTVYVSADGKFEAAPDTAQLQLDVLVQDESAQAAYQRAAKNVEQVREVLRANGLDPKAATVGYFSVQPVYEWKPKQKVIGYVVRTDVTLKLKDFSKVGSITQQLADANVSETQTLNYILENVEEAKDKAVDDAYRRARSYADTIARVSGRTLGDLSYASVDTFEPPRPFISRRALPLAATASAAQPAPTEEFTPQMVNVTAHVNVLFNLK